jgi:ribonuclease BN (tRNA processing enzyme)
VLPSAFGSQSAAGPQYLTSYVINGTLAVDAGCLGFCGLPAEQARIRHVLISHTHMDHVASLPILVENHYAAGREHVTIHGSSAVLESLRRDLFNNRVWFDLISFSMIHVPLVKLAVLEPFQTVTLEGLHITPAPVNHTVPTMGFLIEDDQAAIAISSDTGPTEALWELANRMPHLKAVFLETTFPNHLAGLAGDSKHLTPALLAQEVRKLNRPVRIIVVHIKAPFRAQVVAELENLGLPNVEIGRFDEPYVF